ncbi:MAG: UvrD-helicase domain-containing protein, partial [Porticoccaceae bacterium]|nr:UvrD-helicase domain-containing protein [Porticoccaceae bacterium]
MTKLADHQARAQALDTSQSFAVAAPAGSGKTGLLTQRILCLLAEVEAPEEILCMTFTRKAAGEMRHRLIDALVKAENNPEPADAYEQATWSLARRVLARDKAQNWQLIAAPNRLRILTIDSFCRNLASQLVLESGFGDLPEPVDNPDKFYRLAIHDLLGELESNSTLGDSLSALLIHLDNDIARLEGLLLRLLSKREQWLPHIFSSLRSPGDSVKYNLEQGAQSLIEETLYEATEHLAPRASDLAMLADYAAQHLESNTPESDLAQCLGMEDLPSDAIAELPRWFGLADLLLTKSGGWRKTINKKAGFPTKKDSLHPDLADARKKTWAEVSGWCQQQVGLLETLNDIRYLPAAQFGTEQWQVLEALTNTLPQLSARLNLIFRSENVCDYTEITLAALTALGDEDNPTDLTLRLDNKINHILVDEFQDTSSVHFDILRRLTAGWQNNDGRTLFFVGDGMQSLYGFRNANVGLFMDVREHPLGEIKLEALDLNVNFRSQANIIGWVNRLFSGAFPALANTGRGAVPYTPSEPFKAAIAGPAVHLDIFEDDPERLLEAEQVAQKVVGSRAENPSASIAILVRGRAHLREILPALREHGLAWQATDIDPLASCMPVIDLLSLTRAMLNPADRIAWLAILRSPWCGLSLDDLLCVSSTNVPNNPTLTGEQYPLLLQQVFAYADIESLSDEGRQILKRVAATLAKAWQQRYRKPMRVWLEGLWIDLGGAAALVDEQSLGQCRQYWDLLESHAQDASSLSDWSAFESAVDNLYAEPAPLIISAGEGTPPPIQIMTIHKAKGLEFDTVILPGLDRRTRSNDAELLLWRERVAANGRTQLLLSPPQKLGGDKDQTYEHLKREESLKGRLENTRVIYVACTRAIKHLHLLFKQADKDPAGNSLLAALWPTLKLELEDPGPDCQITRHAGQADLASISIEEGIGTIEKDTSTENDIDNSHRFQSRLAPDWRRPAYHGSAYNTQAVQLANQLIQDDLPLLEGASPDTPYPDDDPVSSESDSESNSKPGDEPNDARQTGILFHRTLQYLVADGLECWDTNRIAQQKQFWQRQTQEQGFTDPDEAIDTMMSALTNCLNDAGNAWIFDRHLEDSACELA